MNRKSFIPLVGIAFAVAVVSTWIFYGLTKGHFEEAALATARTVVVAKHSLEPGAVVLANDLEAVNWAGKGAPDDSFATTAQAVGGRVIAKVSANEPLTRLAVEVSDGSQAANVVPVGKRAVPLRASDSDGLMRLLARGSLVDIQAVSLADGQSRSSVTVKTILERIPIVDIRKPGEDGLGRTEPAIVTVLVEASEADRLALADAAGKIRFALRNPGDTAAVAPEVEKPTRTGLAVAAPSVQGLMVELTLVETANESDTPGISVGEIPAGPVVARWTASASGGSIAWIDRVYQDTHVRLSLRPTRMSNGRIEALVEPEISWPGANASGEHATEARRLSRPMAWNENQRLVVSGLSKPGGKPAVLVIAARRMPER